MTDGKQKKEDGMSHALSIHEAWQESFREAIRQLADTDRPFTSEDAVAICGLPTGEVGLHRNNAVGAMMSGLAKQKVIKKTGKHILSRRSVSHATEINTWVGYHVEI